MARYATGKKAWGFSDRSGFRYRLREMKTEWNGLKVGPDEYEAKHPQLEPNHPGPDPTALYQPRVTSRTEVTVENLLGLNPFKVNSIGTSTIIVTEKNHGRSGGDTVRFRKCQPFFGFSRTTLESASGHTVVVTPATDENTYIISLLSSGETSTTVGSGGGGRATAGPVTLEA
tara:strand:+ start:72 stop:590 length:519 start_codon:yes stop_codon:yes gene_type:complete